MAGPTDPLTTPRHKASILSLKAASVVGRAGVCGSRPGFTVVLVVVLGGGGGGPGRGGGGGGRAGPGEERPRVGIGRQGVPGGLGLGRGAAGGQEEAEKRKESGGGSRPPSPGPGPAHHPPARRLMRPFTTSARTAAPDRSRSRVAVSRLTGPSRAISTRRSRASEAGGWRSSAR